VGSKSDGGVGQQIGPHGEQAQVEERLAEEAVGARVALALRELELVAQAGAVRIDGRVDGERGARALQRADQLVAARREHRAPGILGRVAAHHQHLGEAVLVQRGEQRLQPLGREVHRAQVRNRARQAAERLAAGLPAPQLEAQQVGDVDGVDCGKARCERGEVGVEGRRRARHELDGETGHGSSRLAMQPAMQVARVPARMARSPRRARSGRRSGAMPPTPPIRIAIEPKLAKPHSA
jgi:hypothetical protein